MYLKLAQYVRRASRLHMALSMIRCTEHLTSMYVSGIQSTDGGESENLGDGLLVEELKKKI